MLPGGLSADASSIASTVTSALGKMAGSPIATGVEIGGVVLLASAVAIDAAVIKHEKKLKDLVSASYKRTMQDAKRRDGKPMQPLFPPEGRWQLDDIDATLALNPQSDDPHLRIYYIHSMSALRAALRYYVWRISGRPGIVQGDESDMTSAILSGLVKILVDDVMGFRGYNEDIKLLGCVRDCITEIAKLDEGLQAEREEHLSEVYGHLEDAEEALRLHRDSRSLSELTDDFEMHSTSLSDQMIRTYAKLLLPQKHWQETRFTHMGDMMQGLITKRYKHNAGFTNRFSATELPPCLATEWVKSLASDSMTALNVDEYEMLFKSQRYNSYSEAEDKGGEQYKHLKNAILSSPNVYALRVKKNENEVSGHLKPLKDDAVIKDRINRNYFKHFQLIYHVIHAQALVDRLQLSAEDIGSRYYKYSHHCDYIFGFSTYLENHLSTLITEVDGNRKSAQASLKGSMPDPDFNALLKDLDRQLAEAKALAASLKKINDLHHARKESEKAEGREAKADKTIYINQDDPFLYFVYQMAVANKYKPDYEVKVAAELKDLPKALMAPVPLPPAVPPQVLAQVQRFKDPALSQLYGLLFQLRGLGQKMKMDEVVHSATELEQKLEEFYGSYAGVQEPQEEDLSVFKAQFLKDVQALHTKLDKQREESRKTNPELLPQEETLLYFVGQLLVASGAKQDDAEVPLIPPAVLLKMQRQNDPALNQLYTTLQALRDYGSALEDEGLSTSALQLANDVEQMLEQFYSHFETQPGADPKQLKAKVHESVQKAYLTLKKQRDESASANPGILPTEDALLYFVNKLQVVSDPEVKAEDLAGVANAKAPLIPPAEFLKMHRQQDPVLNQLYTAMQALHDCAQTFSDSDADLVKAALALAAQLEQKMEAFYSQYEAKAGPDAEALKTFKTGLHQAIQAVSEQVKQKHDHNAKANSALASKEETLLYFLNNLLLASDPNPNANSTQPAAHALIPAAVYLKMQRQKDPILNQLYSALLGLRNYGETFKKTDANMGQDIVKLADQAEEKLEQFYSQYQTKEGPKEEELAAFRTGLSQELMTDFSKLTDLNSDDKTKVAHQQDETLRYFINQLLWVSKVGVQVIPSNTHDTHEGVEGNGAQQLLDSARYLKIQRLKNPSLNTYLSSLLKMREYGEKLMLGGEVAGQLPIDLANQLEDELEIFYSQFQNTTGPTEQDLTSFKAAAHLKCMGHYHALSEHRNPWLDVLGNVLIALSLIGIPVLIGKAIHSYATEGSLHLFWAKTGRQEKVDEVMKTVDCLVAPPGG